MPNSEMLISCLCISKGSRERLQRAIQFYCRQTWRQKELVLVVDDTESARSWLPEYMRALGRDDCSLIFIPPLPKPTILHLGEARNISVERARGGIICQWDDDDFYHPERLTIQCEDLMASGCEASFLGDQLHYFADTRELYWTSWHYPGIPGTLMCRRSLGIRYMDSVSRGECERKLLEDSILQKELIERCKVKILRERGWIYTYVFHGANTWDRNHHDWCARNLALTRDCILSHRKDIVRHLKAYFPAPLPRELCHPVGGPISLVEHEVSSAD